jgi:4-hydroxybenzoate polyprenyltransferase/phosphoserine phosphatase
VSNRSPPEILEPPLCVDLDGTLTYSDTAWELAIALLKQHPFACLCLPFWLLGGLAHAKAEIARRVSLDWAALPYVEPLLQVLREEKARGRRLILVSGADRRVAAGVADHLGLFEEVLSSDGVTNLVSERKAGLLTERFGHAGFDYAGNCAKDLAVWKHARLAYVVNCARGVTVRCEQTARVHFTVAPPVFGLGVWRRLLRVHQWAKNTLLAVPLLTSHELTHPDKLLHAGIGFFAFCFAASSIYIVNDLFDLPADRAHRTKRLRPLATGVVPIPTGLLISAACFVISLALALLLPPPFMACFAGYYILTTSYTVWLKRQELLDVLTLAALYGLRVVAGGTATDVPISYWLLVFCIFFFLSLAFMKRYTELIASPARALAGRGYHPSDLGLVSQMGIASGFLSALVLGLYVASPAVALLYQRPYILWPLGLAHLYWISRAWLIAHRGEMRDDPVVFALYDPASYLVGLVILLIAFMAGLK